MSLVMLDRDWCRWFSLYGHWFERSVVVFYRWQFLLHSSVHGVFTDRHNPMIHCSVGVDFCTCLWIVEMLQICIRVCKATDLNKWIIFLLNSVFMSQATVFLSKNRSTLAISKHWTLFVNFFQVHPSKIISIRY